MGFSYEQWEAEFGPRLKTTRRWHGFSYIAKELSKRHNPKIFEVGCVRVKDSWQDDGQSTLVWDWIVENSGGSCVSFDIDEAHVALARLLCPSVAAYVSDGLVALAENRFQHASNLDVLFLDGMDFTGPHAYNAWLQHIGLLAAAWPNLKKGCLVVLDDCVDDNEGKHVMIKDFFRRMGNDPMVESYMHIWEIK